MQGICSQVGRVTGMLCWRRGFELLWQHMQMEKIIDYIHLQRYNDQFLLTCHFCLLGNSENKQQRLEAFVIMHKYAQYTKYAKYAQYICKYAIKYAKKYATKYAEKYANNMPNIKIHKKICRICKLRNMHNMLHMQNMQYNMSIICKIICRIICRICQ
jgi:hypothetical protein